MWAKNSVLEDITTDSQVWKEAYDLFREVFDELCFNPNISINDSVQLGDFSKAIYALIKDNYKITTVDEKKITNKEDLLQYIVANKKLIEQLIVKLEQVKDESKIEASNGDMLLVSNALRAFATLIYKNPLKLEKEIKVEEPLITVYKAKHGELCIRFPDQNSRNKFLKDVGHGQIPSNFVKPSDKQFILNPNRYTPVAYKTSPQCVYLPSYQAKSGEFAVNVTRKDIRDKIIQFLGLKEDKSIHCPNGQIRKPFADGFFSLYDSTADYQGISQETAIYFKPNNPIFTKPGAFVKIDIVNQKLISGQISVLPKQESENIESVESVARQCDFD